jgi:hypothetical protein
VILDHSVDSLRQIDGIIEDLRQDHKFEDVQPLLFSMGCYIGEVFVRHASAKWCTAESAGLATLASSPIVVVMPDGRGCNPVGRAYQRFQNGAADGLADFYLAMVNVRPRAS